MASRFTTFWAGQNRFNCLQWFSLTCGLRIFPSIINKSQVRLYIKLHCMAGTGISATWRRPPSARCCSPSSGLSASSWCHWPTFVGDRFTKQVNWPNCNTLLYPFLIFVTGRWFCSCVFSLAWFCFHRNVLYLDNTGECHQERPGGGGGRGGHEPERDGEDRR